MELRKEQMADLLQDAVFALPDPSKVEDVMVLDKPNPHQDLLRAKFGTSYVSGSSRQGRQIYVFQPKEDRDVLAAVAHEWSLIVRGESTFLARMFDIAAEIEKNGYHVDDVAKHSEQNFAVHLSEFVLSEDEEKFWLFARRAPVRTMVLGRVLEEVLRFAPVDRRSKLHEFYSKRVSFIASDIEPYALEFLISEVSLARNASMVNSAVKLLLQFGDEEHLSRLTSVERLDLSFEPFGDVQLMKLALLPWLEEINFRGTMVSMQSMRILRSFDTLVSLGLALTPLTNLVLKDIPPCVTELNLASTKIDDGCVSLLSRLALLKKLDLTGTGITDEGVAMLQESLPECAIMR